MKLEVGKKYILRCGDIALITNIKSGNYPFVGELITTRNYVSFTEDGYDFISKSESDYDVIEEFIE